MPIKIYRPPVELTGLEEARETVTVKTAFTRRYREGEFGNASPTWEVTDAFIANQEGGDPGKLFHLRNKRAGGATYYNLTLLELRVRLETLEEPSEWYISEMCPTHLTTLQGEVERSHRGLELTYTRVKRPMRDALAESQHYASGLAANQLLLQHMCPNSFAWFEHLLDTYPSHVVEFTCLSRCWGTVPRHNTIFWEVRLY